MTLTAKFELERGQAQLDVDLTAQRGESLVLVGPNGAGKTSALHAIAGLLRISAGAIRIGNALVDDARATFVEPERRAIGYVFQDALLFPHMTVLENVAFGLRARGHDSRASRAHAASWLDRVGLMALESRRPGTLSGGEAQRVALARALAWEPDVLLLDEPLASVDASARLDLRRVLRAQLDSFSGVRIVVAHDAVDAFALAERIAVFERGRVVQTGTVHEVCGHPRSRYVADLVGINLFRGVCRSGVLELEHGGKLATAASIEGNALATVHPRAVALYRRRPDGSPRNVWSAHVTAIESVLDRVRVQLGGPVPLVAEVTQAGASALRLGEGGEVWLAVKATEVTVYPA